MSKPITWKNINAGIEDPDLTKAAALMDSAGNRFDKAFAGAGALLQKRQNIEQGNQENQVRLNTEQFEKSLRDRYKTAEEFQAARESGAIQAERDQFGPYGLDTEKTDAAAMDSLVSGMQQRQTQQHQYDQQQRTQRLQPVMDTYLQRMNSIDSSGGIDTINKSYDTVLDDIENDDTLDAKAKNELTKQVYDFRNSREGDFRTDRNDTQQQNDRTKRLTKQEAQEEADYLSRNLSQQYAQDQVAFAQQEADILKQYGMTPEQYADPSINQQIPPEIHEEIESRYAELGEPPTERQYLGDLRARLSENRLLSNEDINTQVGWFQDNNFDVQQLTKSEENELTQKEQSIDKDYQQSKNEYRQWAQSDESASVAVNRILANTRDNWDERWNDEEVYDRAMEFATEGVKLEGENNRVKIPPSAIEYLLSRPDLAKFWSGTDPTKAMKALLAKDHWADQLKNYQDAERAKSTLRSEYMGRAKSRNQAGKTQALVIGLNQVRNTSEPYMPEGAQTVISDGVSDKPVTTESATPDTITPPQMPGGFAPISAEEQADFQNYNNRDAQRRQLTETLKQSVGNATNKDEISSVWSKLQNDAVNFDETKRLRSQLLNELPLNHLENPEASPYLKGLPKYWQRKAEEVARSRNK